MPMSESANPPALPTASPPARCGLALASLILGISGIVLCLGPLAGIPGVICGHLAQSKINHSGGALSGGGLALAGLITGYISIAMIVFIGLLAAIAIPNFVKARSTAQTGACVANLRQIEGAKAQWALEHKKENTDVPTEADLFGADKYIRERHACPAGGVYTLNRVERKPTCSVPGHEY
jgi:competence protein ComGC